MKEIISIIKCFGEIQTHSGYKKSPWSRFCDVKIKDDSFQNPDDDMVNPVLCWPGCALCVISKLTESYFR